MKTISMSGSLRENVGKKGTKQVRKQGLVPVALYGHGEQKLLSIEEKQINKAIFTPDVYLIQLDVNGEKYLAILQEVQFHPVTDQILHVDLLEVKPEKPVVVSLPLKVTGNSIGVLKGGKLVKKFRKLKVKGLIEHLPEQITIDITNLDINNSIRVADMKNDHLTFLDNPSSVIVAILPTRAAMAQESGK